MAEHLLLKWGTLKGWKVETDQSRAALERYANGGVSHSVMMQKDTPDQRAALLDLIDAIDGEITNDWSGENMTKNEAKEYISNYDKR